MSSQKDEPQPSTSRSKATARRPAHTVIPTPDWDSDSDFEDVTNRTPQNKTKKVKGASMKRSHSVEDANKTNTSKRKKTSKLPGDSNSSSVEGEESHENVSESKKSQKTPFKSFPQKNISRKGKQQSLTQPPRATPSNPKNEFRTQLPRPIPSVPPSVSSQSIFTQNQLLSHPGVIKSLQLTNFMCHNNFTHDFHPNLNFITGQNGSGKSALLSGILIALGGKATVTSRTTSLKALVQKGKSTCRVAVTLLNKNGLRRYGEEITIERWVSVNGSAGYRIKGTEGNESDAFTWRPLKKPELDRILLGLNIQIDNPVAILNQEVARSFLRSKDPKVKFTLFYDGTLLSKLETVIEETRVDLDETKSILLQQRQILDALKAEIMKLRQKVGKIAELDHIKEKLTQVQGEYLWAVVLEQEKDMKVTKTSIAKASKEIELLLNAVEDQKSALAQLNAESILREQGIVQEQLAEKQQEMDANRTQLNESKRRAMGLMAKLKTITSSITARDNQIKKLEASLEKVKAAEAAKAQQETNEDEEIKEQLQGKKKHYESVYASLKQDQDNFQQAGDQERENLQQVDIETRGLRTTIENKRRQISAISGRNASKYAMFGSNMEHLMSKVQTNLHRFRKPPKGPLGACFRVRNPAYASIIEGVLLNHLYSFVVGDARDMELLKELIRSVYSERGGRSQGAAARMPGIHFMQYSEQMYDVSRNHASHPNAPSILNLIEVENNDHLVLNALIDIADIERQIIFKDNQSAATVLKDTSTAPKTLKQAYTLQWYKFTPAPHYAARVMKIRNRAEILKSGRSKESEIQTLKAEIKEVESEIRAKETIRAELKKKEQSLRQRYEEKAREVNDVRRKLGETSNEIKRHMDKIKEKERRCDFTSYYEELQDLKDDRDRQVVERDTVSKDLEPMKPRLNELENIKKKLEDEIRQLESKMNDFEDSRDKLSTRRMELNNTLKRTQDRLATLEGAKSNLTRELAAKEAELNEKLECATKDCPLRIDTKRTPADVKKEFEGIKVRITETEARLGNIDELRATLQDRMQKFNGLKQEYCPLQQMHKVVQQTNVDQQKSFFKMKAHMGRTLTYFFSSMAKQRGYEGRLLVDFETKELYYFVCPDGDSSSKTVKAIDTQERHSGPRNADQLKQSKTLKKALVEYSLGLSGGERSFATICFIMALWQVMECPFYMLDEFDVFMDAFNRKTSQLALMAHAKRFIQNQFVLFTPLDLGEVPSAQDACVLRLFPPVRGGGGAGSSGSQPGPSSSSNQEEGPSGRNRQSDGSPNVSTENIDPSSSVSHSQAKGNARNRGKQRRRSAVMNEI